MFSITRENLVNALAAVTQAVERRNTIPILSNCLIHADLGGIVVTGSDMDVQIDVKAEADKLGAFDDFTVPAVTLHDIARKLPAKAEVTFTRKDATISVSAGRSRFSLPLLPASDFPELAAEDFAAVMQVEMKSFNAALSGVAFAISTEETRFYLNGVYMHALEDGGMAMVATDGHRLAKRELPLKAEGMPAVIVPRKTVGLIGKILEGEATFSVNERKIRFSTGTTTLTSKLIDGTFPDYRRVIPTARDTIANLDGEALKAALDRVITVSSEKSRAVRFAFAEGMLNLKVNNPDAGTAEDSLAYEGDCTLETGFNARYMADALASLGGETIELAAQDASSPAVLRTVPEQPGALCVVMPMRV